MTSLTDVTQIIPGKTQTEAHNLDYVAGCCKAILSKPIMPPVKYTIMRNRSAALEVACLSLFFRTPHISLARRTVWGGGCGSQDEVLAPVNS